MPRQSSYDLSDLLDAARNPLFVATLFWVSLSFLGLIWPAGWSFVFAMMLGFVSFDFILGPFAEGRKIPLSESYNEFKAKGWVFGAFLIGIVIATGGSAILSQLIASSLADPTLTFQNRVLGILTADLIVTVFLWVDFDSKVWNG